MLLANLVRFVRGLIRLLMLKFTISVAMLHFILLDNKRTFTRLKI